MVDVSRKHSGMLFYKQLCPRGCGSLPVHIRQYHINDNISNEKVDMVVMILSTYNVLQLHNNSEILSNTIFKYS